MLSLINYSLKKTLSEVRLIVLTSLLFSIFFNLKFISELWKIYPHDFVHVSFIISLQVVLFFVHLLFLNFFRSRYLLKPLIIFILILSTLAAYSMDQFGVIVDEVMLLNLVSTHESEAVGLATFKFFIYFFFLTLLPIILLLKARIDFLSAKKRLFSALKVFFISLLFVALNILSFNKYYASFFREHKYTRYYTNPLTWVYSSVKLVRKNYFSSNREFEVLGEDSKVIHNTETPGREVIILVIGETVRGDHFSLNGYPRETNPLLKNEQVYSFKDFISCGTSTSISVPCIFSSKRRSNFKVEEARSESNLLDMLVETGKVEVLWRDNNSDSKGVADRITYKDYKNSNLNTICDSECRDVGMLVGLKEEIVKHPAKDILIVLHQMGNHGPAYFERYPKEFEYFKPACHSNELQNCSNEEIVNAYDNAIRYTDYFLNETIKLLKEFPHDETAMLYISDHGESLGEGGVYLHGMPYVIAPVEQRKVAALAWFGGTYNGRINRNLLKQLENHSFSHDNVFHTVLGLFETDSLLYNHELDIFKEVIDNSLD